MQNAANTVHADLILAGGRIFTADAARSWAQAIAVRGERIVAIGGDRAVMALAGPRTRVIDLRGRAVTPGFGDAHSHPSHGGLARIRCELHDAHGLEAYLDIIATYAREHPAAEWIQGGGWSMSDFPGGRPHRELLDRIVPDRPVLLSSRDGHDAWVNSRALELAGIDRDTPQPPDGRIVVLPDGTPMGTLSEGAIGLVGRLVPPVAPDDLRRGLLEGQRYLHSLGITNWQEAIVEPGDQDAYVALAQAGELTGRVVGALWWDRARGIEQIEELAERRARGRAGRFAPDAVKLMQDGVIENGTAAMLQPLLDLEGHQTDNTGISFVDPAVLNEAVTRLDALGIQPHFHAIGDRAVREALDAVEAARRANGWSDTRPHIAHLQFIHPDDLPRFRQLGVIANAQTYWAVHEPQMDELTLPLLAPEVAARQYPLRSLLRHGATLAMGSDWSVSTPDPFAQVEVAVTRMADYSRGANPPFMPEEAIELVDALTAFTAGSAYVSHLDEAGTLAVGKLADLAVLDRDPFDPGAGPIGDTRVVATFVGGAAVYEDPSLDG
jgi:hypothetical protein